MGNIVNIARWELFKLPRRKMPWILLAILLTFTQLGVWGTYLSYSKTMATGGRAFVPFGRAAGMPPLITCNDLRSKPEAIPAGTPPQVAAALQGQCRQQLERLPTQYRAFSPMGSISSALGVTSSIGLILLGILAAFTFGSEYGLGTLRPILVRGVGRVPYLAGKFLMLVTAATGAMVLICALAGGSGLLATHIAVPPPSITAAADSSATVLSLFARTWGSLIAFGTMACAITILTRSTMAGMALSLGYYIFEGIFIRLMTAAFSWFETVGDYLPMRNISALGRDSASDTASGAAAALAAVAGARSIDTTHAIIVVGAYVIAFAAIAITVFRNRDIVGASGG